MKTTKLISLAAGIFASLVVGSSHGARAAITLVLSNPVQAGNAGDVLTYNGTIANSGQSAVFLNGDFFNPGNIPGLTFDDSLFLSNAPSSLNALDSYTGGLFTVTVNQSYLPPADFTFGVTGGSDGNANDTLASADAAVVPEPSSVATLSLGALLAGAAIVWRRRQSA
jgi:hypothetical protein